MSARAAALAVAVLAAVAALDPGAGLAADAPSSAAEAARPLVLLVVDGPPGALGRRLEAELEGLGFAVRRVHLGGRRLGVAARERGARAAVRVHGSLSAIEVWVTDGNRTALRDVVVARDDDEQPEAVIALRAVELLRAAFLDIDVELPAPDVAPTASGSDAAAGTVPAPGSAGAVGVLGGGAPGSASAAAAATAAPATSVSALPDVEPGAAPAGRDGTAPDQPPEGAAGGGAMTSDATALGVSGALLASAQLGGPTADAHLQLGVRWPFHRVLHAAAWLTTPGVLAGVERAEGASSVRTAVAGVELGWSSRGRTALVLGAGVGGAWVSTEGDPAPGYLAQDEAALVGLGLGHVGLRHALGKHAVLLADLRGALAPAPVTVRFAGRTVAHWGRPLLLPSLGIEVTP